MFKHDDERRTLLEMESGEFKACKVVTMKAGAVVGDHHHRNKDERFLLVSGHAKQVIIGDKMEYNVSAPAEFDVPRNTYHAFWLEAGSVLVGVASGCFDATDEIQGEP